MALVATSTSWTIAGFWWRTLSMTAKVRMPSSGWEPKANHRQSRAFCWLILLGKYLNNRRWSDLAQCIFVDSFRGKFFSYEDPDAPILKRFNGNTPIVLTLPEGVSVEDLKWISVWCRSFKLSFGDLIIGGDGESGNKNHNCFGP